MDLYFILSGTLFILCVFGVFEKFLKYCQLNRWMVSGFLFLSTIFSVIGNISISGTSVSFNLFLYIVAFLILFIRKNSPKGILFVLLTFLTTIAVLVCYNAVNLSSFEYAFIQPYVYVSIVLGFLFSLFCQNFSSAFCGTILGSIIFEIIFHQLSVNSYNEALIIGNDFSITYTLICSVSFIFFYGFNSLLKTIKQRKREKIKT